jgi:small subunit ribosomal protein S17
MSGARVSASAPTASRTSLRVGPQAAQTLQGKVVSTKGQNTVVVAVERMVPHPLYKKRCRQTTRFKVHQPTEGTVELGDIIEIEPCRPISKSKHFVVGDLIKKRL